MRYLKCIHGVWAGAMFLALLVEAVLPGIAFSDKLEQDFLSPDRKCHLRYKGAQGHGEGTFFRVDGGKMTEVLKAYFRYGPMVNWESASLAEIFIPEGSPGYHSYYYDCASGRLSPSYGQTIALNTKTGILVAMGDTELYFYRLFSDKPSYTAHDTGVGLVDYFMACESDAFFIDEYTLKVEMKCYDDRKIEKEFTVPPDSLKLLMRNGD